MLSSGSPHESTTFPPDTATACTRCRRLDDLTAPDLDRRSAPLAAEPNAACQWSGFTVCSAIIDRITRTTTSTTSSSSDDLKQLRALRRRAARPHRRCSASRAGGEHDRSSQPSSRHRREPSVTTSRCSRRRGSIRVVADAAGTRGDREVLRPRRTPLRHRRATSPCRRAARWRPGGDDVAPGCGRADALAATTSGTSACIHVRLDRRERRRFERRLNRLVADVQRADEPDGRSYASPTRSSAPPLPPRAATMRRFWPTGEPLAPRRLPKLWSAETVSQFGMQVSQLAIPLVAVIVLDASAFEVARSAIGRVPPVHPLHAARQASGSTGLRRRPILIVGRLRPCGASRERSRSRTRADALTLGAALRRRLPRRTSARSSSTSPTSRTCRRSSSASRSSRATRSSRSAARRPRIAGPGFAGLRPGRSPRPTRSSSTPSASSARALHPRDPARHESPAGRS